MLSLGHKTTLLVTLLAALTACSPADSPPTQEPALQQAEPAQLQQPEATLSAEASPEPTSTFSVYADEQLKAQAIKVEDAMKAVVSASARSVQDQELRTLFANMNAEMKQLMGQIPEQLDRRQAFQDIRNRAIASPDEWKAFQAAAKR